MYSFFFALGQLAGESSNIEQRLRESASIALKIVGDMAPYRFRHGFYSEFDLFGLYLPVVFVIPESPCESGQNVSSADD